MPTKHFSSLLTLSLGLLVGLAACSEPELREYEDPPVTEWVPSGVRPAPVDLDVAVLGDRNHFWTFHGDALNSDEIETAFAPKFEMGWVAEPAFYIPEGPTFDRFGNLYFVPAHPVEKVLVVSVDLEGRRRWAMSGDRPGMGGAPLVLNHPEEPGRERVYAGSYASMFALDTDGVPLWDEPTGLEPAGRSTLMLHNWGLNYHPPTDALVAVLGDGHVVAHRRLDGKPLVEPYRLPGSPAADSQPLQSAALRALSKLSRWLGAEASGGLTDPARANGSDIVSAVMGAGAVVSNYFSIDPSTGTIWIASTAPDAQDAELDQRSENGALYALRLESSGSGFAFAEHCRYVFRGGSSSTPALRADGERIYIADDTTSLFAIDSSCEEIWRIDLGEKLLASVAVASDNGELYGISGSTVKKVIDRGDHATLEWEAKMDMFEGATTANLSTAGIAANGVMVHIGAGRMVRGTVYPKKVGLALLDRKTGVARYATEGVQESIAAMSTNIDGGVYLAHSPVRTLLTPGGAGRVNGRPVGGIGQYRPIGTILLARDAVCAGAARAKNAARQPTMPERSGRAERRQIQALIVQARGALDRALSSGELATQDHRRLTALLESGKAGEPVTTAGEFKEAGEALAVACTALRSSLPAIEPVAP